MAFFTVITWVYPEVHVWFSTALWSSAWLIYPGWYQGWVRNKQMKQKKLVPRLCPADSPLQTVLGTFFFLLSQSGEKATKGELHMLFYPVCGEINPTQSCQQWSDTHPKRKTRNCWKAIPYPSFWDPIVTSPKCPIFPTKRHCTALVLDCTVYCPSHPLWPGTQVPVGQPLFILSNWLWP